MLQVVQTHFTEISKIENVKNVWTSVKPAMTLNPAVLATTATTLKTLHAKSAWIPARHAILEPPVKTVRTDFF